MYILEITHGTSETSCLSFKHKRDLTKTLVTLIENAKLDDMTFIFYYKPDKKK